MEGKTVYGGEAPDKPNKRKNAKKKAPKLYVVYNGRERGIYESWAECKKQVECYNEVTTRGKGAIYRSFPLKDRAVAEAYLKTGTLPEDYALPAAEKKKEEKKTSPPRSELSFLSSDDYDEDLPALTIYSDGSAKVDQPTPDFKMIRGGYGVFFGSRDDPRNLKEEYKPIRVKRLKSEREDDLHTSSNTCELMGIARAVDRAEEWTREDEDEEDELPPPADSGLTSKQARERGLWIRPRQLLVICCDSKYSIRSIGEWYEGWVKRGWRTANGQPVRNRTLIEAARRRFLSRPVLLCYVPGHSGVQGNEEADRLANEASDAATPRPQVE